MSGNGGMNQEPDRHVSAPNVSENPKSQVTASSSPFIATILSAWGNVPPSGNSIHPSQVAPLLSPRPGNSSADLDWIPHIPPDISSLLLHNTLLFGSLSDSVCEALKAIPPLTLKHIPNTLPSISIPQQDSFPEPLTKLFLNQLTMPPHLSFDPPPNRYLKHLPALSRGIRTKRGIVAILSSSHPEHTELNNNPEPPASPSATKPPLPAQLVKDSKTKPLQRDGSEYTSSSSPSSAPSPIPLRKKPKVSSKKSSGNSLIRDDLVAFIDSAPPNTGTIPKSLLTCAMDCLGSGSLRLTKENSQRLVASCMPHIESCRHQTLLRPNGTQDTPCQDMDSSDGDNDEHETLTRKYTSLLQRVEAGMIASHVVILVYLVHPEIVVADYALAIADAFKNQIQETVLVPELNPYSISETKPASSRTSAYRFAANGRRKSSGLNLATIRNVKESSTFSLPHVPSSVFNAEIHALVYQIMCLQIALMPRLQSFVMCHANVSALEPFAISASYGAMAPLYTNVSVINDAMRTRSMELVAAIASSMPSLRIGILEDTVGNLLNSTSSSSTSNKRLDRLYRLEDGTSILVSTALILHLIQALLSFDPKSSSNALPKSYATTFQECTSLAIHVVKYLLSRATKKSKATVTNESEYLILLRSVFEDVMAVLPSPEFPAAELMARVTLQLMIGVMEDESSATGVGDMGIKSLAMDVFASLLCHSRRMSTNHSHVTDAEVQVAKTSVSNYLDQHGKNNSSLRSAHLYYLGEWSMYDELASNVADPKEPQMNKDEGSAHVKNEDFNAMHPPDTTIIRADVQSALNILFARISALPRQTEPILGRVVQWFDAKEAHIRARAIKVLSAVAQVDPSLMDLPYIQTAIQARLCDASPSVRDSVLDVVGKWVIASAEGGKPLNASYLSVLLDRSMDKSTSVRKRAIKTLGILAAHVGVTDQIEIAVRVFLRLTDEEETVVDVARRVFLTIVFPQTGNNGETANEDEPPMRSSVIIFNSLTPQERLKALAQATVFANLVPRVHQDEIVSFLRMYTSRRLNVLPPALLYQIQSSELFSLTQFDALRALGILAKAVPRVVTVEMLTHCAQFLPRSMEKLQKPSEGDLQLASLTLGLFRDSFYACDPVLSPIAAAGLLRPVPLPAQVLEDLETCSLRIVQCGFQELVSDAVALSCLSARRLERSTNGNLVQLLASVTNFLSKAQTSVAANSGTSGGAVKKLADDVPLVHVSRLLTIMGSIAQYGGLILIGSPPEPVFSLLTFFAASTCNLNETIRATALRSLGQMSLQYGKILLQPGVLQIIQKALANCDTELLVAEAALDLIVQFMAQEDAIAAEKFAAAESEDFDRQAFLGTATDFVNAGIAESLAQSCVYDLLKSSLLVPSIATGRVIELAQEAIGYITQNRLTHPKLVMPAVMALQSSPQFNIATRARSCHVKLNSQHRSTIYDANRESVGMAFDYQVRLQGTPIPVGYTIANGTASAHLTPFYMIIRDSKRDRKSFLVVLMRFFEYKVHPGYDQGQSRRSITNASTLYSPSASNIGRCKWIAENLATLEYHHEDEVLVVLNYANSLISSVGLAIKVDLEHCCSGQNNHSPKDGETGWDLEALVLGAAVYIILVSMKSHLIQVYNISTSKLQTSHCLKTPDGNRRATSARVMHRKDESSFVCPLLDEDLLVMVSSDKPKVDALCTSIHAKLDELLDDPVPLNCDSPTGDDSSSDLSATETEPTSPKTSSPSVLLAAQKRKAPTTPRRKLKRKMK